MSASNIKKASLAELRAMKARGEIGPSQGPGFSESLGPDFWADAELVMPKSKKSVHLRVDADVLTFFKAQGKGHLTRMNAVLKAYVEAHKGR
jgi:uncharacterized protein (DUF4415 family)